MTQLLNHYSYAAAAAVALLAVGWWAYAQRSGRALAALGVVAVLLVGADLLLRPGEPTVSAVGDFDRVIVDGRPSLVEFYSNY